MNDSKPDPAREHDTGRNDRCLAVPRQLMPAVRDPLKLSSDERLYTVHCTRQRVRYAREESEAHNQQRQTGAGQDQERDASSDEQRADDRQQDTHRVPTALKSIVLALETLSRRIVAQRIQHDRP